MFFSFSPVVFRRRFTDGRLQPLSKLFSKNLCLLTGLWGRLVAVLRKSLENLILDHQVSNNFLQFVGGGTWGRTLRCMFRIGLFRKDRGRFPVMVKLLLPAVQQRTGDTRFAANFFLCCIAL